MRFLIFDEVPFMRFLILNEVLALRPIIDLDFGTISLRF